MQIKKGDTVKIKGEVLAEVVSVSWENGIQYIEVDYNVKYFTPDEVYLVRNINGSVEI